MFGCYRMVGPPRHFRHRAVQYNEDGRKIKYIPTMLLAIRSPIDVCPSLATSYSLGRIFPNLWNMSKKTKNRVHDSKEQFRKS